MTEQVFRTKVISIALKITLVSFVILFILPIVVHAQVIGEVLSTDIGAMIDAQPIESFNINGHTYVIAEDLSGYGFNVEWNNDERTLSITRNPDAPRTFLSIDKINRKKSDIVIGKHLCNAYSSDIVTYVDGEDATTFNVNGKTLIMFDELSRYGYINYDNERRLIKLNMLKYDLDNDYKNVTKEDIVLETTEVGQTTYSGEVNNDKPNGFGKVIKEYDYPNGLAPIGKIISIGYYNNGIKNGQEYYISEEHDKSGSFPNMPRIHENYRNYSNGKLDGYNVDIFTRLIMDEGARTEGYYINGTRTGFGRDSIIDFDYIYGYRVISEGVYDSEGDMIKYESYQNSSSFGKIEADWNTSYVKKADGTKYSFGEDSSKVPVLTDEWVDEIQVDNTELSDVKIVSSNGSRVLLLKDDGTVYFKREQHTEPGARWCDGMDLSEPVKVMENGKNVYVGNSMFVIKNDNSLWMWNNDYYNRTLTGNECYGTGNFIKEPIKIIDDAKQVVEGNGFILVIKNDDTLWAKGENEFGQIGNGTNEYVSEPVKIMDNVVDIKCGVKHSLALKSDGTLWTWGNNHYGQLGNGTRQDSNVPIQIKDVYSPIDIFNVEI